MKKSLFNLKFAFENRPVSDAPRLAILYSGKIPGIVPWQGNRNRLWVGNNKHRALSWPLLHLPPLNPDLSLGPSRFNMGRGQLCLLFLVLCMILISLGLILTSIVTDYWYNVQNSNSNTTVANTYSYSFGMWRKCYTKDIPKGKWILPEVIMRCSCWYYRLNTRLLLITIDFSILFLRRDSTCFDIDLVVVNFGSSLSTQAFVIKESLDHLFSSTIYQNHVKVNIDDYNTTKVLTWTSFLCHLIYDITCMFLVKHFSLITFFFISFVFSLVKRVVSCFCV